MGRWVSGSEGGERARCMGEARGRTDGNEKHSKFGESQTKAGKGSERTGSKGGTEGGMYVEVDGWMVHGK